MKYREKILTLLLLFSVHFAVAQDYEFATIEGDSVQRSELFDNVFLGGSFGLAVGTVTYIEIAPTVGYRFQERIYVGLGASYSYYKDTRYDISNYYWGLNSFIRITLFKGFYLQGETDVMNVNDYMSNDPNKRLWVNGLYGGLGLSQKAGERAEVNLTVLWNFNENAYSVVSNPNIKIQYLFFLKGKE